MSVAAAPLVPRSRRPALAALTPVARWAPAASIDALGGQWWAALDAAETALRAASRVLPADEFRERSGRLRREREDTVGCLDSLARVEHVPLDFSYLRVSRSNLRRLLGLPSSVVACVFNLDGVLIGSAAVHAAAWAETFDEFVAARAERTHGRFAPFNSLAPFNPSTDYAKHIHGKTRLEGVRAFLASRGISLPEGDPRDPPGAETVHGLANRKNTALLRRLDEQGVAAITGSKRYLETAREAGIHCAAVSASANTGAILGKAGLLALIEQRVDGNTILAEDLRPRPAPDIPLAACRALGVVPEHAAVFETSPAGVAAARSAGFERVIGVDPTGKGTLRACGADRVITGLADLLEGDLAA
jgi:beta-phosphoglucomutase-like phosphatase (HAD superfamily)